MGRKIHYQSPFSIAMFDITRWKIMVDAGDTNTSLGRYNGDVFRRGWDAENIPSVFRSAYWIAKGQIHRKLRIFWGATTPDQRFYVSDISHLVPDMCHVSQLDLTLKNGDEWDIHGDMNGSQLVNYYPLVMTFTVRELENDHRNSEFTQLSSHGGSFHFGT